GRGGRSARGSRRGEESRGVPLEGRAIAPGVGGVVVAWGSPGGRESRPRGVTPGLAPFVPSCRYSAWRLDVTSFLHAPTTRFGESSDGTQRDGPKGLAPGRSVGEQVRSSRAERCAERSDSPAERATGQPSP